MTVRGGSHAVCPRLTWVGEPIRSVKAVTGTL